MPLRARGGFIAIFGRILSINHLFSKIEDYFFCQWYINLLCKYRYQIYYVAVHDKAAQVIFPEALKSLK